MDIHIPAVRPSSLIDALTTIWEASVRATHHFLAETDIYSLRPLVKAGLSEIPLLVLAEGPEGDPLGFMGLDGEKIEMLFISPHSRGQGIGRRLVEYAVSAFDAKEVDVNEQNPLAVEFYEYVGFKKVSRSEVDGQGNPFPILHMEREPGVKIPTGYTIRHAEPEHVPLLNAIELAAAGMFPPGSIPEHVRLERVPLSLLTKAREENRLWVALDRFEEPVGYALLQVSDGIALLAQLDVNPIHGRKGLGAAMVRRVIKAVQKEGLAELYLTSFSDVPWNAPFYSKLGFAVIEPGAQPRFIQDILSEEQDRGLKNRVAMKLAIKKT